jgi:hypothetical protein
MPGAEGKLQGFRFNSIAFKPLVSPPAERSVPATTAAPIVMGVIAGVVVLMLTLAMVMTTSRRGFGLIRPTLPTGEQHEEKSGGKQENKNDEHVHSNVGSPQTLFLPPKVVQPATQSTSSTCDPNGFSCVTASARPAILT